MTHRSVISSRCNVIPGWVAFVYEAGQIIHTFWGATEGIVEAEAELYTGLLGRGLDMEVLGLRNQGNKV